MSAKYAAATRLAFAEYHAQGSKAGAFMLREGRLKLIYHVGMPPQLFDLEADPDETRDLIADVESLSVAGDPAEAARRLERRLRAILDPEDVDRRAKADQRAKVEFWGGAAKVAQAEQILFTPPPGVSKEEAWSIRRDPSA